MSPVGRFAVVLAVVAPALCSALVVAGVQPDGPGSEPGVAGEVLPAVELWPGPGSRAVVDDIVGITPAGVFLGSRDSSGASPVVTGVVSWDRVRAVRGPFASGAGDFLETGRVAWRARTRLQRGDSFSAEPLFESLFAGLDGTPGVTPAIIAEGLLRCRLRRGALASAVPAWLELIDARAGPGVGVGPTIAGLRPVLDPQTGLVPALPPIWVDGPAVSAFAANRAVLPPRSEGPADRPGLLADLYHASAVMAVGGPVVSGPFADAEARGERDAGMWLVWAVTASQLDPGPMRSRAIAALHAMLSDSAGLAAAPWREAWARAALGSAMVGSADPVDRRLGIAELLHVPARFTQNHSYLAGLCLARAAQAADDLGYAASAAALRDELASGFAGHPALLHLPTTRIGSPSS